MICSRASSMLLLTLLPLTITGEEYAPEYRSFSDYNDDDVLEYQRFQHYGFKTPGPERRSIDGILAFLAPIAAIPIITGATLSGLAAILPIMTSQNTPAAMMGRRKRDVEQILFLTLTHAANRTVKRDTRRDFQDLDVIQKYLTQVKPHHDYNEEVLATYLGCSGMLDDNNHCLEKLVCQFSDNTSAMSGLEKDVSSLIIYTILNNRFVSEEFKNRMKKAAFAGRDHPGKCRRYSCIRTSYSGRRFVH